MLFCTSQHDRLGLGARSQGADHGAADADYLARKVSGWTIDRVVEEMLNHRVSYFPVGWELRIRKPWSIGAPIR
ncbi:MAG: hypothetical protein A2W31_18125 [Planctomycetes bacterium RBG_16_64_10]|nr:MAG: hypothetical protein A2W31_18125 [Planctomycetes bacterium RBG_16_64_10]